jgi:hypothetical protein
MGWKWTKYPSIIPFLLYYGIDLTDCIFSADPSPSRATAPTASAMILFVNNGEADGGRTHQPS